VDNGLSAFADPVEDKSGGMPLNAGANNLENVNNIEDEDERMIAKLM
jgi:hypothetical protein